MLCADTLPRALVIGEEEELVAKERSAKRSAKLVLVINAAGGREIIARIQIGVAQKVEHVAVKLVGSRLRNHVDEPAAVVAVLGVEVIGDNSKLSIESTLGMMDVPFAICS